MTPERSRELLNAYAATRCGNAFRELVAAWRGVVYATALRVARGQEAVAEDVTQAVFARLSAAPGKVRDGRALGAWLQAAATGTALDVLRREARRRRREEASCRLVTAAPEPPAPDVAGSRRELSEAIDTALGNLPPQDSELIVMRFWQRQDWRTIGRKFGVSDAAAQKRLARAMDRLRRDLARRGITGTSGILSSAPVGFLPHDRLTAAVLARPPSGSATLTTAAMTAKSKIAIAAALIVAAASPMAFRQRNAGTPQQETRSLSEAAGGSRSAPVPVAADVPENAPEAREAAAAPADTPASDRPDAADAATGYDAFKRRQITEQLAALRTRLSLTPEQEAIVAGALEIGQHRTKIIDNDVKVIRATVADKAEMADTIAAALTPDQQIEYRAFLEEARANAMEAVANRELANLQSMTTLTPEQKDRAFAAFAEIASWEAMHDLPEPGSDEPGDIRTGVDARWTARQDALARILTPEQFAIYQTAGNPFTPRGHGG